MGRLSRAATTLPAVLALVAAGGWHVVVPYGVGQLLAAGF